MFIHEYAQYNEEEIKSLYSEVGWVAYTKDLDSLREGFANSLLVLAAYEDDELVGIARLVGDGHTIVFVQDLLVRPKCQRQGIGTALLKEVLRRYSHIRQIELVADDDPKAKAFYRSLGFKELTEAGCTGFMRLK